MKKENKNEQTRTLLEILRDPERARNRFKSGQRLASDLMRLVESGNAEAIMQLAEHMEYDPDQLTDDIIDLYDLFGAPDPA